MPEAYWLTVDEERARYAHHDNVASNEGYVEFLCQVADVVERWVGPGGRVLEFGSGENQVLTSLLRKRARTCNAYDPLYGIGPDVLREKYDAIVLCEVIEHLHELRAELARLAECLRPGGSIVVRTQCYLSVAEVPSWWYARDATHINFFARRTLELAAALWGLRCQPTREPDIVVWSSDK